MFLGASRSSQSQKNENINLRDGVERVNENNQQLGVINSNIQSIKQLNKRDIDSKTPRL